MLTTLIAGLVRQITDRLRSQFKSSNFRELSEYPVYQISNMNPCGEIRLPSAKGKNPFRMTKVWFWRHLTEDEKKFYAEAFVIPALSVDYNDLW